MWITEEVLEGDFVLLEPLQEEHISPLQAAVKDGELWRLWYASVPKPEDMQGYVYKALKASKEGNIAYAVRSKASDQIVGTTRYYAVDESNRRAMWAC